MLFKRWHFNTASRYIRHGVHRSVCEICCATITYGCCCKPARPMLHCVSRIGSERIPQTECCPPSRPSAQDSRLTRCGARRVPSPPPPRRGPPSSPVSATSSFPILGLSRPVPSPVTAFVINQSPQVRLRRMTDASTLLLSSIPFEMSPLAVPMQLADRQPSPPYPRLRLTPSNLLRVLRQSYTPPHCRRLPSLHVDTGTGL